MTGFYEIHATHKPSPTYDDNTFAFTGNILSVHSLQTQPFLY
jgi:hypothetical protein